MGGVVERCGDLSGLLSFVPRFFGFVFLSFRLSEEDSLILRFDF